MIAVWSMNSINHRMTIKDLADVALDDPIGSGWASVSCAKVRICQR